jgi:hypothetical protein
MADEQLTPLEEAKLRIEQSGYADTELEPYIVLIKRWDKEAEIHRFNPYMTVDGRVKELRGSLSDGQTFSIRTYFNTSDLDQVLGDLVIPARSCVAVFTDPSGGVHHGTASIGTSGMVDQTNPYENAETSAVGRALGLAGYGLIPGAGIASAEEVTDAIAREGAADGEDDWRSWPVAQLGQHKMPGRGWGKEGKFPGWTFEQVYDDSDGHGAMAWAAGLDGPKGIAAMMARYFNLREGQEEPVVEAGSETDIPFDGGEMVLIAGKRVNANNQLSPPWAQWVSNLAEQNTGEGKLFGHKNHLTNHLKKHYAVAKTMDMTGRQAAAFVRYIQSGGGDQDPAYYAPESLPSPEQDAEDLFGAESLDELLRKAAPNLAPPHNDDPQGWYKQICEMYGIGPVLTTKQLESMRKILQLIASGVINLREIAEAGGGDDPMFRTLCESLTKVAQNGK